MAAPIGNTCPDIDKAIKKITGILNEIGWIEKEYPDLKREMTEIENCCGYIEDTLESLRSNNSTLREWGLGQQKMYESSEEYAGQLEDELSELKREIENLR